MSNIKDELCEKNVKQNNILLEEILESKKIQRFLKSQRNPNTRPRYEYHIGEFFKFINQNPDKYLIDDYEFLPIEEKKKISKKYKRDIEDFKNHLVYEPNKYGRENKPSTIRTILSVLKSLFTYCDIDFSTGYWKRTNNFKNSRTSIADTPTPEQLRRILDNTDLQGRCIFGIMKDSGSRISSVLTLRRKDIILDREYPIINFYYKNVKNGITKKKRCTPETKHFLESYFEKNKFKPDDKLFSMHRNNANYKWNCAIEKTNLERHDENTGRLTMTTHCLKRFFKTYTSNLDKTLCEYFCEHGNLNDTYYNAPDEELDKHYSKIVNKLLVYERPYDTDIRIKQLQKENEELKGKVKFTSDRLSIFETKSKNFENRFAQIEKNLNISLNPKTSQTQNYIDIFRGQIPNFIKFKTDREPTPEELERITKEYNEGVVLVLNELRKLPTDEILKLCKPENLPYLYDHFKKKKSKNNIGEPHSKAQKD